jgi:hypothetical protein
MFYSVLLGGEHPRAKLELHDIVFLFADRIEDAYDRLRAAWFAAPAKVHIDGWIELDGLDGYRIEPSEEPLAPGQPRLYCAQLGGYAASVFGEAHPFHLVVAPNAATAKRQAKQAAAGSLLSLHTDALIDVDRHLLDSSTHLRLTRGEHRAPIVRSEYRQMI